MVTAPVRPDRVQDLRDLLATMNSGPGMVDPMNGLVPFGRFDTLHVARFVIADDQTLDDRTAFPGLPLVVCGVLKIGYDLALLYSFRHIKPPEEQA